MCSNLNCAIVLLVLLHYNGLFVDAVSQANLDMQAKQYRALAADYLSTELKKEEMLDAAHALLKSSGENAKVNQILSEIKIELRPEVVEILTHFMAEYALRKAEEHIRTLNEDDEKHAKKQLTELVADHKRNAANYKQKKQI